LNCERTISGGKQLQGGSEMSTTELREMLELAALAAGVNNHQWVGFGLQEQIVHGVPHCGTEGHIWAPQDDDGDSFRLAVVLGLDVSQGKRQDDTPVAYAETATYRACENHGNDPLAATRMAVLRCAAEIGKSMHQGETE
jgi:hypothetical protein